MANVSYAYEYAFPSLVENSAEGRRLKLATCGGVEKHPYFFSGRLLQPRRCADLLLAVSEVSRTRFYSPTEVRERMLAMADPVVTSGGERLRFEAFSVCCGVYARLDLRPESIDGEWHANGTTNVDFNPPMRAALINLSQSEKVGLNVGADMVELEHSEGSVVERKVKLPVRWLKGFLEVQAYQTRLKPKIEVSGEEARRFFRSLPIHQIWQKGTIGYIVPAGKGLRLSVREAPNSVTVGAAGRLKFMEPLMRHAKVLRIYGTTDGISAWEVVTDDSNLHIVLSPEASRGFSGEGQVLSQLARGQGNEFAQSVRAALKWQAKVDSTTLAQQLNVEHDKVADALAVLGTRGLVGFDASENAFFHRELPFDMELVEDLQPRLVEARKMVEAGAVRVTKKSENRAEGYVQGSKVEHRVVIDDGEAKCTCQWYAKNVGNRGECRHVLALEIVVAGDE